MDKDSKEAMEADHRARALFLDRLNSVANMVKRGDDVSVSLVFAGEQEMGHAFMNGNSVVQDFAVIGIMEARKSSIIRRIESSGEHVDSNDQEPK